jgi:hypothetical protein
MRHLRESGGVEEIPVQPLQKQAHRLHDHRKCVPMQALRHEMQIDEKFKESRTSAYGRTQIQMHPLPEILRPLGHTEETFVFPFGREASTL